MIQISKASFITLRASARSLLGAGLLCWAGCLTSPNAFYESRDIIQDPQFAGTYVDLQEQVIWTIASSATQAGRYDVTLRDHEATGRFLATLFKLGQGTYVDLVAVEQSRVHVDDSPSGEIATVSQAMKQLLGAGQHAAFRVALAAPGLTCWYSSPDVFDRLSKLEFGSDAFKRQPYWVVVSQPTSVLRNLLLQHGAGKELFSYDKFLERAKPADLEKSFREKMAFTVFESGGKWVFDLTNSHGDYFKIVDPALAARLQKKKETTVSVEMTVSYEFGHPSDLSLDLVDGIKPAPEEIVLGP